MIRACHIATLLIVFLATGSGSRVWAQEAVEEYTDEYYYEEEEAAEEYPEAAYEDMDVAPRSFDNKDWERLQRELDYSGKPPKEKVTKERTDTPPREPWNPFEGWPDLSPLLKVLFILLLIGLVGWILYLVVQMPDNTKIAPNTLGYDPDDYPDLERLEADLADMDVDPFLRKAEQDGNYHLAVRLHFLALLKTLNEAGHIQWKKDHTNRVYINQMRGQAGFPDFQHLTRTFERVWYGDQHPPHAEYVRIREQFTEFIQQLKAPAA